MEQHRKIGAAIALISALAAAAGVLIGFLSSTTAAGVAVAGLVIGSGVARGAFSTVPNATKKN